MRELFRVIFIGGPVAGREIIVPSLPLRYLYPVPTPTPTRGPDRTVAYDVLIYQLAIGPMDLPSMDDAGRYVYRFAGDR